MADIRIVDGACSSRELIGTNSSTFANGDLVSVTSGFAVKATAGKKIVGFSNGTYTFASNNQTVAKAKINFTIVEPGETRVELPTSASITDADVGKYYDINSSQQIDVTTAVTSESGAFVNTSDAGAAQDVVVQRPFRLAKVLSSTRGVFIAF